MVRLVPMTESEFTAYRKWSVQDYAQQHIRAGNWSPADAPSMSEKTFRELLPEGLQTKGHFLFSIHDEIRSANVGMIWLKTGDNETAFICDVNIDEHQRRRGHGLQALQAVEAYAHRLGLRRIKLHVFGHNQAARALYEKMGYAVVGLNMAKPLGEGAEIP